MQATGRAITREEGGGHRDLQETNLWIQAEGWTETDKAETKGWPASQFSGQIPQHPLAFGLLVSGQ